jgi:hypothetical protein
MNEPYITDMVEVQCKPCPFCGKQSVLLVSYEGYLKYREGAFIQDAFPTLSPDARELLISGTCPECWDRFLTPPEEEDDEDAYCSECFRAHEPEFCPNKKETL